MSGYHVMRMRVDPPIEEFCVGIALMVNHGASSAYVSRSLSRMK